MSPVFRIEPVGELPDLDRYSTIVITSGNGVERIGRSLGGRIVRTVGDRTSRMASEFGAESQPMGENVEAFLTQVETLRGPILIVRGAHTRGDLASKLSEAGFTVEEAVLYDQIAVPLSPAARSLLTGSAPVIAPVFSPRSARLLATNTITAPFTILAISAATAEAWGTKGEVRIAARPTAEAMCDLVEQAF